MAIVNPVPRPFNYEVGNTGVYANDIIAILNANGGNANNLGLTQPNGITRNHLRAALGRTNDAQVRRGLNGMINNFRVFDDNGDGRIALGDVQGFVRNNIRWYHPFNQGQARDQLNQYMQNGFGINRQ